MKLEISIAQFNRFLPLYPAVSTAFILILRPRAQLVLHGGGFVVGVIAYRNCLQRHEAGSEKQILQTKNFYFHFIALLYFI